MSDTAPTLILLFVVCNLAENLYHLYFLSRMDTLTTRPLSLILIQFFVRRRTDPSAVFPALFLAVSVLRVDFRLSVCTEYGVPSVTHHAI